MLKWGKNWKQLLKCLGFVLLMSALMPQEVYAYIDPGTTNLIFQLIIAVGVGSLFVLKVFWYKIKRFFTPKKKRNENG